MAQPWRLPAGGRIDRSATLAFSFNGGRYTGHVGDTLASALLANGVHLVARSFKYHRPRGIFGLGAEEPNALVQLASGGRSEPNLRATQIELYDGLTAASQNCWPSVDFDLAAVNDLLSPLLPAGFYYKTFMWPASMWMRYERHIRRMAGMGRAADAPDPDRYVRMHAHCDVLVIGAGPAGLAAALAAGRNGARVILADEGSEPGGQLLAERYEIDARPAAAWVAAALAELGAMPEVRVLSRTTITGYYDHNYLIGCERVTDHLGPAAPAGLPRQRLWKIRAREVVLATGSIERPIVFPDNDRPGVMLAAAARGYVNRYGVLPGRRAVVVTNNDDGYRSALDLSAAGGDVAAVVDLRADARGFLAQQVRARGIELLAGHAVVGTRGRARLAAVQVAAAGGGGARTVECDLVCVAGGWVPTVHLFSQSRGRLRYDTVAGAFVPGTSVQAERSAGACRGSFGLRQCIAEGFAAGAAAARAAGTGDGTVPGVPPVVEPEAQPGDPRLAFAPAIGRRGKQFVDLQNDVTAADLALAAREGYDAVEHLKRYTTTGMGTDQGKTSNLNALSILAELRDAAVPEVGTTTFRPPYTPLCFGAIAGADVGPLFDPVRRTPIHDWHQRHGCEWENVGQWRRPWYYPRPGESMQDSVNRECRAARESIGVLDASTLGKIDVQGADAGEFLDRIYCNAMRSLAVGRCRYGLMLKQDGMVFDDGIAARLGEHHYLLSTTTGGAARVLGWLEEWLQTEWPELDVRCTSVTEQYAQIALVGPRARDLLAPLTDVELATMPFMAVREGRVAGIGARVFSVSFTGGEGYEVAVPASRGYELWTTLMGAGERFGITPYGTEAMHVLRAEKGFIIVGQETDGTVTPHDLGLSHMVKKERFFVGRRSLARSDTTRADRKQLIGLLTDAPDVVLPEGAQVVAEPAPQPPMAMIGHVTSSYFSARCGRSIALALIKGGRDRIGATVHVPLVTGTIRARVVAPSFLDAADGARRHG